MSALAAAWIWAIFFLALLAIGGYVGWKLAQDRLTWRLRRVDQQEAKLQAQWDALHSAQRLNAAFMEARRRMAEEAIRQPR